MEAQPSGKSHIANTLALVITGAGIAAAAWLIVAKPNRDRKDESIDFLLHRCDKSANKLEQRTPKPN